MIDLLPLCGSQTTLTSGERELLAGVPGPAFEVEDQPCCELQGAHSGPHVALGQESDATVSWWVVWFPPGVRVMAGEMDVTRWRVFEMPDCPAENHDVEDGELCRLLRGHPGAHSFAMEPGGLRTPSAPIRAKIAAGVRRDLDPEQLAFLEGLEAKVAAPGTPLALISRDEATVIAILLTRAAADDYLVEEMTNQLIERMDARLEAMA